MSFLTVNGVPIPVLLKSARARPLKIQDAADAFDGSPRRVIRTQKQVIEGRLTVQSQALGEACRQLLEGAGHTFPFDADFYSSKGLGTSATAGTPVISTAGPKRGAGNLDCTGAGATATWATGLGSAWTVFAWVLYPSAWNHFVIRSDGAKWLNGVRDDAAYSAWLSVASGSMTLSLKNIDDVVALPYSVPDAWPSLLYAEQNARAFSLLDRIRIGGDAVVGGPVNAIGECDEAELDVFVDSAGTRHSNGESWSFRVRER